ncbi:hypothetical protein [Pseudobacteroides cellulosolvens]|uniref:Uncharacterized protein n=1 Tax=Pseudobacteroides cellulosolvens ATCC 35603 = DSM 2933 TaxID=398512 RepID=A0A0L6JLJ0_9FIRM|nr:hypothetical protein [Pseudobacteroides cellulosolvens]KNY26634.1 hypothetical protein Bccel_1899 [Pseudobacteroides cellulosolvens ATCC 35603 = DSM 2933]
MEKRRLSCSRDWTTLTIANFDEKKTLYLNYYDINRIEFDEMLISKLFKKVRSEKIQIFTNTFSTPIEFTKHKDEKYFEEYKQELTKFARDNKISLIDRIIS